MRLTDRVIAAAVGGDPFAISLFLEFYDDYINKLATVRATSASGKLYRYVDPDVKAQLQLKLMMAIRKFKI